MGADTRDNRAFELVNKTNQFNLNGKRFSESDWLSCLQDPAAFVLTASYEDKYGPLGKIAVVMGKAAGRKVYVSTWVMSCRAFSRRIEHQCLKYLFEKLDADEIVFDYEVTPRNGPIQDFFAELRKGRLGRLCPFGKLVLTPRLQPCFIASWRLPMSEQDDQSTRLHHVGFVVASISNGVEGFKDSMGADWNREIFHDPLQKAKVTFLRTPSPTDALIELVEPAGEGSPVLHFLQKGGGLHHLCYEVEDLDSHLTTMRAEWRRRCEARTSGDCVSQQTHCLGFNGTEASP